MQTLCLKSRQAQFTVISLCHGRPGLRLGTDGKKCVDIDECAEGTAQCEQECVNKDPRESGLQYRCACRNGYSIDMDNQYKCIPKVRSPKLLACEDAAPDLWKRDGVVL